MVQPSSASDYPLQVEALEGSRCRLGIALCGYVLMPDYWQALIGVNYPLTISQVLHDVKKVSARKLHQGRGTEGPMW